MCTVPGCSFSRCPVIIARILDTAGIDYSVVAVAAKIGSEPDRVFKTLVARRDRSAVEVFCMPGNSELDLKKAAQLTGNKRVELVHPNESPHCKP